MKLLLSPLSQQADLALQEAIRIAQESNDHVCLQHCLVGRRVTRGVWVEGRPLHCSRLLGPSELAQRAGADERVRQHRPDGGFGEDGRPLLPAGEFSASPEAAAPAQEQKGSMFSAGTRPSRQTESRLQF